MDTPDARPQWRRKQVQWFQENEWILVGILLLFLLESFSVIISIVYAKGLLTVGGSVLKYMVVLLFVPSMFAFAPLLALLFKSKGSILLIVSASVGLVGRAILPIVQRPLIQPDWALAFAVVSQVGFLCFFVFWLGLRVDSRRTVATSSLALSLCVVLSTCARVLGTTRNFFTTGFGNILGYILVSFAAWMLIDVYSRASPRAKRMDSSFGTIALTGLGWTSTMFLVFTTYAAPNVLATGTRAPSELCTTLVPFGALVLVLLMVLRPSAISQIPRWLVIVLNVIFILAQTLFNDPYVAENVAGLQLFCLAVLFVVWPILVINFSICAAGLAQKQKHTPSDASLISADSPKTESNFIITPLYSFKVAAGVSLGMVFWLICGVLLIFSLVWPYVPLPLFFANLNWLPYLLASLGSAIPAVVLHDAEENSKDPWLPARVSVLVVLGVTYLVSFIGTIAIRPSPSEVTFNKDTDSLSVVTFNMQQGYNYPIGQLYFEDFASDLLELKPDVIGIQESSCSRITAQNQDLPRFLATKLNYHYYLGPKTVSNTYGIALLSRFPIVDPETVILPYNLSEKAAYIRATLQLSSDVTVRAYVTHLGQDFHDVLEQAQTLGAAMRRDTARHKFMVCDCNFSPAIPITNNTSCMQNQVDVNICVSPPPYNATMDTSGLLDSWLSVPQSKRLPKAPAALDASKEVCESAGINTSPNLRYWAWDSANSTCYFNGNTERMPPTSRLDFVFHSEALAPVGIAVLTDSCLTDDVACSDHMALHTTLELR